MISGSISVSAPYVAAILILVIGGWMVAVRSLGKQFASIIGDKAREDIGEVTAQSLDERVPEVKIAIPNPSVG